MNYDTDNFSSALPVRSWRNGILVRVPDSLKETIPLLRRLQTLSAMIPEYCGLFAAVPEKFAELYSSLKFISVIIPLASPGKFWSREEISSVRQLRAGAVISPGNSLCEQISLYLTGIPQRFGFNYLPPPSEVRLQLSPVLKPDDLRSTLHPFFRHHRLLILNCNALENFPGIDFTAFLKAWIKDGGIAIITGSSRQQVSVIKFARTVSVQKVIPLCGELPVGELLTLLFSARAVVSDGDDLHSLSPSALDPGILQQKFPRQ